jgi:hypothetical protein
LATGDSFIINLDNHTSCTYLFAMYTGRGATKSEVWYVGDLTGLLHIPFTWGSYPLAGWILFGAGAGVFPTAAPLSCCSRHSAQRARLGTALLMS